MQYTRQSCTHRRWRLSIFLRMELTSKFSCENARTGWTSSGRFHSEIVFIFLKTTAKCVRHSRGNDGHTLSENFTGALKGIYLTVNVVIEGCRGCWGGQMRCSFMCPWHKTTLYDAAASYYYHHYCYHYRYHYYYVSLFTDAIKFSNSNERKRTLGKRNRTPTTNPVVGKR